MLLEDYFDCVDMILAGMPPREEWVQESRAEVAWASWIRVGIG